MTLEEAKTLKIGDEVIISRTDNIGPFTILKMKEDGNYGNLLKVVFQEDWMSCKKGNWAYIKIGDVEKYKPTVDTEILL